MNWNTDQLYNAAQGLIVLLGGVGIVSAAIRARVKARKEDAPKLPGDTFSSPDKVAVSPEIVAMRLELASMRADLSTAQEQTGTALEQNTTLFRRMDAMERLNGAFRRRIRQLEDGWPLEHPKPAVYPSDVDIIRSIINEDTQPRYPKGNLP